MQTGSIDEVVLVGDVGRSEVQVGSRRIPALSGLRSRTDDLASDGSSRLDQMAG